MACARGRRSRLRLECELLEERVLLSGNPFPPLLPPPPLPLPALLHVRSATTTIASTVASVPSDGVDDPISLAVAKQPGSTSDVIVYGDAGQDKVYVTVNGTQAVACDISGGLDTPAGVLLADLNNDGIPDLIVCSSGNNRVLIFPGLGNGQFGPELNGGQGISTGIDPVSVAVWQPDPNAPPELFVTNKGSNIITILRSQDIHGQWSMVAAVEIPAGLAPTSALVADLSPGGPPDLIITDSGSNQVRILPGTAQGGFDAHDERILPTGADPQMSLVVDFSRSDKLALVTVNAGSNDLTVYQDIDSDHPVAREISSGGLDPVAALLLKTETGTNDLVVANQGNGTVVLFTPGADGLQPAAAQQSPGGHPTSLAADPSGDPFSFYVVDAGQESATVMSFAAAATGGGGGTSGFPVPPASGVPTASSGSTQNDTASLSPTESALLSLDSAKFQAMEDRAQTVSLQPLTATTVGVVPTLLVGEGDTAHADDPNHPGVTANSPLLVPAKLAALLCPDGGGEGHKQGHQEQETATAPPEEPGVQRFVLGADEAAAPGIAEDGTTEPASPVPMNEPLPGPVTCAPAMENLPEPSRETNPLPCADEQTPQRQDNLTRTAVSAEAWQRALLAGVALGLAWERRQRREGESDL